MDLLSKQLWLILHRTIISVRMEPTIIVTVLRIIEREERYGALLTCSEWCLWRLHSVQTVTVSTPCSHRESTRVHHWPSTCRRCHVHHDKLFFGRQRQTLFTPRTRLRFGERAFRVAAPKAWNQLPNNVRSLRDTNSFKKKLKTFLFTKFYYV